MDRLLVGIRIFPLTAFQTGTLSNTAFQTGTSSHTVFQTGTSSHTAFQTGTSFHIAFQTGTSSHTAFQPKAVSNRFHSKGVTSHPNALCFGNISDTNVMPLT